MVRESTKIAVLVTAAAAGLALVALPWMPTTKSNPLPERFERGSQASRELVSVLQWHDEACVQGDLEEFRNRVTSQYASSLGRRLRQLGRTLDASALRDLVGADRSRGLGNAAMSRTLFGMSLRDRACLLIAAPSNLRGVLGYTFQWDGKVFRLDTVEHQPSLTDKDDRGLAAFARRLVDGP